MQGTEVGNSRYNGKHESLSFWEFTIYNTDFGLSVLAYKNIVLLK